MTLDMSHNAYLCISLSLSFRQICKIMGLSNLLGIGSTRVSLNLSGKRLVEGLVARGNCCTSVLGL